MTVGCGEGNNNDDNDNDDFVTATLMPLCLLRPEAVSSRSPQAVVGTPLGLSDCPKFLVPVLVQ